MKLYSANNKNLTASFREAVLKGLAPDGGLYMPGDIPNMPPEFWQRVSLMSFQDISFELAKTLIGDEIPEKVLRTIIDEAINFDAPLVPLIPSPGLRPPSPTGRGEGEGDTYVLELFHGPTLAFKDFAARTMARLMSYFVRGADRELTILVATSGDTGSAVAHGFLNVPGIRVVILYPSGAVSPSQEKMITTMGGNITTLEIQGTFDDCQKLVKQAFVDTELSARLWLSSANSISIARLIPQMFYYAHAYAQLLQGHSAILRNRRIERGVVFSVPSGNFGNLTAGLMAKRMGLPVAKFVAASNANDVVPEYLETGEYKPRPSQKTLSNAMDVGAPSNFARMLELYGHDAAAMRRDVWGVGCSDEQTRATMKEVYDRYGYMLDPHGAVGYWGLQQYRIYGGKASGDPEALPRDIGIILETAHPAKFSEIVEETLGISVEVPERMQAYMDRETKKTPLPGIFSTFKEFLMAI